MNCPLHHVNAFQPFNKWVPVELIGLINPPTKHYKAWYIITAIDYLTRLVEVVSTVDLSMGPARFIFEHIISSPHWGIYLSFLYRQVDDL